MMFPRQLFRLTLILLIASILPVHSAFGASLSANAQFVVGGGSGDYLRGMNEVVAWIYNPTAQRREGLVKAESRLGDQSTSASGNFEVAANSSILVRLPFFALEQTVIRVSAGEEQLLLAEYHASPEQAVRVVDAHVVPRLRAVLENLPMNMSVALPGPYGPGSAAPPSGGLKLRVVPAVAKDGTTLLPSRVPTWHGIQTVFMSTELLVGLESMELTALTGFVLAGGTLALSVSRPEDLKHPTLVKLVGGQVNESAVAPVQLSAFPKPFAMTPEFNKYVGVVNPRDEVQLHGYTGGNLQADVYGSTAAYGLGQVALLSFNLDNPQHVDDPWVGIRLLELTRQSFERKAVSASGVGATQQFSKSGSHSQVREVLHKDRSLRWGIVVISLLLCAYSALIGPVLYGLGKKRNDLLLPIRWMPVASLAAFFLVVIFGTISKGLWGESRRVSFVELGSGMSVGVGNIYRGFYTPSGQRVDVGQTNASTSLNALYSLELGPHYSVEGQAVKIGGFESVPSQTVVVREDGIINVGGNISMRPEASGSITLTNNTPKTLEHIVLKTHTEQVVYARRLAPGQALSSLEMTSDNPDFRHWTATPLSGRMRPFEDFAFKSAFQDDDTIGDLWDAMDGANVESANWFPQGVPVALAVIAESDGPDSDSGFKLKSSVTLLRVVGFGEGS
jgi:hypothetical protein